MALTFKQQEHINQLILKTTAVGVYKMVLNGELTRFPAGFWGMPENKKYANQCLIHLIENILCWTPEYCVNHLTLQVVRKYKLSTPLTNIYNSSIATWLIEVYPQIKPWQFKVLPTEYCTPQVIVEAVRWLLLEKLQWTKEQIIENWELEMLREYNICSTTTVYALGLDSNTLITSAIPEIRIDDLKTISAKNLDKMEHTLNQVRQLLAPYTREEIPRIITYDFILKHNLIRFYYEGGSMGIHKVLQALYPNEYKEWEVAVMPDNYWNMERAYNALHWLVHDKLHWTAEQCYYYLTLEVLRNHGIIGVYNYLNFSIESVLQLVYPDAYDYSQVKSARAKLNNNIAYYNAKK